MRFTIGEKDMARGDHNLPILPTPKTMAHAKELLKHLQDERVSFALVSEDISIPLNEELFDLFREILIDLAQNKPVGLTPLNHELTTFQAANFLNVSRPYVIKLIDEGKLKCRMVGTHRRIRLEELLLYRENTDAKSHKAREELAKLAQEHDMGY